MKKFFLTLFLAVMTTAALYAQQIIVVSQNGATNVFQTLKQAIEGSTAGSTIYLPGGGFQIPDSVKINRRLTIVGVSHRGDTENVDGATTIAGNLYFIGASSGSAVMGVYLSGNVYIGDTDGGVENMTIKFCNINSISVGNSASNNLYVNQCYVRNNCDFGNCNVKFENNIAHSVQNIIAGIVNHNIFTSYLQLPALGGYSRHVFKEVSSSSITNNFMLQCYENYNFHSGSDCFISNNCRFTTPWGEKSKHLDEGTTWDDVFKANNGVSISSDYHLKAELDKSKFEATDGTEIGIYGGNTSFSDKGLAPVPFIVAKRVDEKTDASGMLNVKIRVKAGE